LWAERQHRVKREERGRREGVATLERKPLVILLISTQESQMSLTPDLLKS
jgi:hypothetical protein